MMEKRSNWAGNYTYRAPRLHYPETTEQIQELVIQANKLKVLGSRHSFNDIADSPEDLISLDRFERVVAIDHAQCTVTVEAGVKYGQLLRTTSSRRLPPCTTWPHYRIFLSQAPVRPRRRLGRRQRQPGHGRAA